jgi:hypothetical protein
MDKSAVPKYHELLNPLLAALHELGGSGTMSEEPRPSGRGIFMERPDEDAYSSNRSN